MVQRLGGMQEAFVEGIVFALVNLFFVQQAVHFAQISSNHAIVIIADNFQILEIFDNFAPPGSAGLYFDGVHFDLTHFAFLFFLNCPGGYFCR